MYNSIILGDTPAWMTGGLLGKAASGGSTLLNGLINYWPMDEDSGVRYDSVGDADLTDVNTVGSVPRGPLGTVAQFQVPNDESLSNTSASDTSISLDDGWSLSMWINRENSSTEILLVSETGYTLSTRAYEIYQDADLIHAIAWDTGGATSSDAEASLPATGQWAHVVAWVDPVDAKMRISVNGGTPVVAANAISSPITPTDIVFGTLPGVGLSYGGLIGATGIWRRALTSGERAALFNAGNGKGYVDLTAAEKVDLVSYWNLDEASGVRYDSHGDNDLTDNNTVTSETNLGAMNNRAAYGDATSGCYLATGAKNLSDWSGGFSLSLWYNWDGTGYPVTIAKDDAGANREFNLYDTSLYVFDGLGGNVSVVHGLVALGSLAWHHVVATWDPADGKLRIYIDGAAPIVSSGTIAVMASTLTSLNIINGLGTHGAAHGKIDEVAIWERPLIVDEIAELYNGGSGKFYPLA